MQATILLTLTTAISLVTPTLAAAESAARSDAPSSAFAYDRIPTAREKLHGTVTAIDERHDKVTLRLRTDQTADLKIADGLLFNALRYGDVVSVTVVTVNGARTIVGLDEE